MSVIKITKLHIKAKVFEFCIYPERSPKDLVIIRN